MVNPVASFFQGQGLARDANRQRFQDDRARLGAQRQDAAFDELQGRFGDVAGDPVAFGQLAGIEQRQTTFDQGQEDRERGLRQQALANAARAFQMSAERTGDPQAAFANIAPLLENNFGASPDQVAQIGQFLTANPGAAQEALQFLGEAPDPRQRRPVGQPIPVRLPTGGQGFMVQFSDGTREIIDDAQPLNANADTQAARLGLQQERLGQQAAALDLRRAQDERRAASAESDEIGALAQRESALTNTFNASSTVLNETARLTAAIDNLPSFQGRSGTLGGMLNAARRQGAALLPGTSEREIQRNIESLKSNIGIDALLRIKESGAGLGQVPQSQLETLQSLLGGLSLDRDPQELRNDIANIDALYSDIVAKASTELQQIQRERGVLQQSRDQRFGFEGGAQQAEAQAQQIPPELQQAAQQLGVSAEDILFTAQQEGMSPEQVLQVLSGGQ